VSMPETFRPAIPFFVYGTLRPGHGNSGCWVGTADAWHDGHTLVYGVRLVEPRGFPYAIPTGSPNDVTVGALIFPRPHCYARVMKRLDTLEGYPDHYDRWRMRVVTPDGETDAWMYVPVRWIEMADRPPVPGNDWSALHPPRQALYVDSRADPSNHPPNPRTPLSQAHSRPSGASRTTLTPKGPA